MQFEELGQQLLVAIADNEGVEGVDELQVLVELTGRSAVEVKRAAKALFDGDYIAGDDITTDDSGGFDLGLIRLTEKGRRAVGQWPRAKA